MLPVTCPLLFPAWRKTNSRIRAVTHHVWTACQMNYSCWKINVCEYLHLLLDCSPSAIGYNVWWHVEASEIVRLQFLKSSNPVLQLLFWSLGILILNLINLEFVNVNWLVSINMTLTYITVNTQYKHFIFIRLKY